MLIKERQDHLEHAALLGKAGVQRGLLCKIVHDEAWPDPLDLGPPCLGLHCCTSLCTSWCISQIQRQKLGYAAV